MRKFNLLCLLLMTAVTACNFGPDEIFGNRPDPNKYDPILSAEVCGARTMARTDWYGQPPCETTEKLDEVIQSVDTGSERGQLVFSLRRLRNGDLPTIGTVTVQRHSYYNSYDIPTRTMSCRENTPQGNTTSRRYVCDLVDEEGVQDYADYILERISITNSRPTVCGASTTYSSRPLEPRCSYDRYYSNYPAERVWIGSQETPRIMARPTPARNP